MRSIFQWVVVSCLACLTSAAAHAAEPISLDVWPGKAPGDNGSIGKEEWSATKPGAKPNKVTNVTHPSLTIFRPEKSKDTGVAILICPGGGYKNLMMDYEGEDVARWLNTIGITGIVLKYRVPAPEGLPRHLPALQDAQRSLGIIRSKASEWGVDPKRIGVLGFSAGAHLTVAVSTNYEKRVYESVDDMDKQNCRPDFGVVVYPGGLLEKIADDKVIDKLTADLPITANTPPMFIVQAHDDRVNSENAAVLYLAMKQAGVPAELHVYLTGGHGFGIKKTDKPTATWTDRLVDWLRVEKILDKTP